MVIAPCQPMNSYKETFVESVKLARDKGVHLHTHLGEGENEIMVERYGKRTLDWCREIGFVGPDVWIAHGWELQPEEYKVMGSTGTGVSHCPAPAVLGGFPILDMRAMQREGMLISLGCDGSATNDSLSHAGLPQQGERRKPVLLRSVENRHSERGKDPWTHGSGLSGTWKGSGSVYGRH